MTAHVNTAGRPALAPLWTNYEGFSRFPTTAFRTAHGPLLSPSPVSPRGLPRPSSAEGFVRKNNRASAANHATSPSTVSSPRSYVSMEIQSPLVSKLEEVSLRLTNAGTTERDVRAIRARQSLRPREDYGDISTADAFIVARSIRQPDGPAAETSRPFWKSESPKAKLSHRLTLRAVIRPKSPARKTFLIQRSLDIDELRAFASTSPSYASDQRSWPSKAGRKPLPVPATWSLNERRPSTGLFSSESERHARRTSHPSTGYDKLIRDSKTVPIRMWSPTLSVLIPSLEIPSLSACSSSWIS